MVVPSCTLSVSPENVECGSLLGSIGPFFFPISYCIRGSAYLKTSESRILPSSLVVDAMTRVITEVALDLRADLLRRVLFTHLSITEGTQPRLVYDGGMYCVSCVSPSSSSSSSSSLSSTWGPLFSQVPAVRGDYGE